METPGSSAATCGARESNSNTYSDPLLLSLDSSVGGFHGPLFYPPIWFALNPILIPVPFSSVKLASHTGSTLGRGWGGGVEITALSLSYSCQWLGQAIRQEFLGLLGSDILTGLRLNQLCLPDTWLWGL